MQKGTTCGILIFNRAMLVTSAHVIPDQRRSPVPNVTL